MNALETALAELAGRLESAGTAYMVVGGFANLQWGRPRLTQDLDVTVATTEARLPELLAALAPEFQARAIDPVAFALETGVVPITSVNGVLVDLMIARLAFEHDAIARAHSLPVGGRLVRFATAEDLILQKIVSERLRDREDIEGIVRRQRGKLDLEYLRPRVRALAVALERPNLLEELERLL
ncbi:MAG: nucleotidyltransferase [Candidatus Eisenbacteria bacterium]|nr:nucleotidyltransferase [Candidatus Eisenbacteria bacterium]